MEHYKVEEVVWAKLEGFPWWPAQVTQLNNVNGKGEYTVKYFGDGQYSTLSSDKLKKFLPNYGKHSKTKKTSLLRNIKEAKEIHDANNNKLKNNKISEPKGSPQLQRSKSKKKPKDRIENSRNNETPTKDRKSTSHHRDSKDSSKDSNKDLNTSKDSRESTTINLISSREEREEAKGRRNPDLSRDEFIKNKRKRGEDRKEINFNNKDKDKDKERDINNVNNSVNPMLAEDVDSKDSIINKLIDYFAYVARHLESINIESNRECLLKVSEYLKDYKLEDPIKFLTESKLGIFISVIEAKIEEKDIQDSLKMVSKNLKEQVLNQLFNKDA